MKALMGQPADSAYPLGRVMVGAANLSDKSVEGRIAAVRFFEVERAYAYWALGAMRLSKGDKAGAATALQKAYLNDHPYWPCSMLARADLRVLGHKLPDMPSGKSEKKPEAKAEAKAEGKSESKAEGKSEGAAKPGKAGESGADADESAGEASE